jgi:hypothetical protein
LRDRVWSLSINCIGIARDFSTISGNTYNLILASQSPGVGNVFTDLQKRINEVTRDCLKDAFDVTVGKTTDLSRFF